MGNPRTGSMTRVTPPQLGAHSHCVVRLREPRCLRMARAPAAARAHCSWTWWSGTAREYNPSAGVHTQIAPPRALCLRVAQGRVYVTHGACQYEHDALPRGCAARKCVHRV